MNEDNKVSEPDYSGWQKGIEELPDRRFFFVATMLAMALVVFLVRNSVVAVAIVSSLMLAFGTFVFLLQGKSGDGKEPENGQAKSSDQPGTTRPTAGAHGDVRFSIDDRNHSASPSGLRTSVASKERQIPSPNQGQEG